ncbi:oxidoreductase [Corynebacterium sp. HS2168-gen11]|uniref:oxidoreductase n=1 Tax=Corynebacterium sp. HS2168-gen11 TaxID=2974027 RepID=UPI00216B1692|nr:oxidoreductase [Corynebacterium sp. HS2168-gen11]MCS4536020.1 oxidoreductase [Corynebacterium sp. HS2168-gen11]
MLEPGLQKHAELVAHLHHCPEVFAPIMAHLLAHEDHLQTQLWKHFFQRAPHARAYIAAEYPLIRTLVAALATCDAQGQPSVDTDHFLAQLGVQAVSCGFYDFVALETTLIEVLHPQLADFSYLEVFTFENLVHHGTAAMALAGQRSQTQMIPATVVEVEKRCRAVSVVRVISETPVNFAAGQALGVATPFTGGVWRDLCPAIPANDAGQIEFHIQETAATSALLRSSKPGDTWHLSLARGGFSVDPAKDLLLIAHGTGLAALRAIILELLLHTNPPHTHVFVSAEYPGELYELQGLWQLAAFCPWLFIIPVSRHATDAWWVNPTEFCQAPRGLHLRQTGEVGDIVTSYGTWEGHQVLISGPRALTKETYQRLVEGGIPAANIQIQDYQHEYLYEAVFTARFLQERDDTSGVSEGGVSGETDTLNEAASSSDAADNSANQLPDTPQ